MTHFSEEWYARHLLGGYAFKSALPKPKPILEADVLPVVLMALRLHPRVAWAHRVNTGGTQYPKAGGGVYHVRFGWPGMLDITGQMKDGRRLDVEVKRPGGKLTDDQAATIATVKRYGGVAFMATGVEDVIRELTHA